MRKRKRKEKNLNWPQKAKNAIVLHIIDPDLFQSSVLDQSYVHRTNLFHLDTTLDRKTKFDQILLVLELYKRMLQKTISAPLAENPFLAEPVNEPQYPW